MLLYFISKISLGGKDRVACARKQGLPASLMVRTTLAFDLGLCGFLPPSCFLLSMHTTQPTFRYMCTTGGVAICTGGDTCAVCKTHIDTHGHANSFWVGRSLGYWHFFLFLVVERERRSRKNHFLFFSFFYFNWGFFDTMWKLQPLGYKKDYMPSSVQTILFWVLIYFLIKEKQKM